MATNRKLKMVFGYEGTEDTRTYDFAVADSLVTAASSKAAILGINASLKNNTAGGLSDFFVSDEGDKFVTIASAQFEEITTDVLDLNIGGSSSVNP